MEKLMDNIANLNRVEELAISMAGASVLRQRFEAALKAGEGDFVPKPSMLNKLARTVKENSEWLLSMSGDFAEELARRTLSIQDDPSPSLESIDLAVKSIWLESKLTQGGAIYGERPFNFSLTDLKIPRKTVSDIQQTALDAFSTILSCQPIKTSVTASQKYIDDQELTPNGARVDIILTADGPKVIEINTQWVDGIQALETFQTIYLGQPQRAIDLLVDNFRGSKRLAILDITRGTGSRSSGAKLELQSLAANLEARFNFSEVEVMDPRKMLPDYLRKFDCFYVNGEPQMLTDEVPEWLEVIMERSKRGRVFPIWRPGLDRKRVLIEASQRSKVFAPTTSYSKENLLRMRQNWSSVVVKGDGYSSKAVGVEGAPGFAEILNDAQMFPQEYVIQPRLEPFKLYPMFCFDTSSNEPIYLPQPRSKFNIWIIKGKVAGVMTSISDRLVISDRDFNVVPKPI